MLKKDLNILEEINNGIGDSSSVGFEDIRNLNISIPGLVSLGFKTSALTLPPTVTTLAYTTDTTANTLTVTSTSGWFNGMAVTLNTVVTSTGISTGRVYWVGDLTATTFKLYTNPNLNAARLVDITGSNGSGTISSYTLGKPIDSDYLRTFTSSIFRPYVFILDENGRAWWIKNDGGSLTSNLVYLGNDTLTSSGVGRGIVVHSQDLYIFRSGHYDTLNCADLENTGIDLDSGTGWVYGVDTLDASAVEPRPLHVARNGTLYYAKSDGIGRITDAGTHTATALDFPPDTVVTSLGELAQYLLIGTKYDEIYPWNKNTPSYENPIKLPEFNTQKIVGTGQLAYVFAGDSGRIYVTNGVSVQLYKKLPEQITNQQDPLITWGDALAFDNNLYFSFSATKNDGTALTTVGGVWGIDLSSGALRLVHQASYGSYAGTTHLIIPNVLDTDSIGQGLIIPWANSTTYGVDYGSTSYYTSYAGYLISPLYRVGSVKEKTSLNELEIILDKPLAANEGVKVSFRPDRTTAFSGTQTFDYTTYGAKQYIHFDFPAVDLVTAQFKIELTGTTTTPVIKDILLR